MFPVAAAVGIVAVVAGGAAVAASVALAPAAGLAPARAPAAPAIVTAPADRADRAGDGPRTAPQADYVPPLPGRLQVVRRFAPPATAYGPGHLGVDLRAGAGVLVRAAGTGRVRFAGSVAGRGVVVIAHPDGISTEYEPVRALVAVGRVVARGAPVGVLTGSHRGCPGRCLHWGARRGPTYIDPLALLRPLAPVRLLPWPDP